MWEPSRCIPYARNARVIPESAVGKVAASIKEFGFKQPIVVDGEGVIVAGHTRLLAAERLGLAEVPVLVADDLTPAQVKAYRLADNRTGQEATWDMELLGIELEDLAGLDIDLSLTGFDAQELLDLKGDEGREIVEDEVPEPPEDPITKPGDLWLLGEHRLLCADSTYEEHIARVMDGKFADMVFTDPPYGVNVTGKGGDAIHGDITFTAIPLMFNVLKRAAGPKAWIYICGGQSNIPLYTRMFEQHFRQLPRIIVWYKGRTAVMRHNGYHSCFELIFYTFGEGGGGDWYAGRTSDEADDVWRVGLDANAERVHPTQKPVEVPARAMRNSCPSEGIVFEPFAGSGSTLIAAEQTGRICYGMEIDPRYCDVVVTRWENLTGEQATLAP